MRVFKADDGAELREEDVRAVLSYVPDSAHYGNTEPLEVVKRVSTALAPKPKLFSAPGVEVPCRVEVAENGTTTWTPLSDVKFTMFGASKPAPTCGANLEPRFGHLPCVLPPGHHPWNPRAIKGGDWTCATCDNAATPYDHPIHAPSHMLAPECWREP
jgi:hypothetical protein